jgi:type IX secretion system PorP/SprF family membrane protein
MVKNLWFSLLFLFLSFLSSAQDGLITHYQFNPLSYNPAFAGETGLFSIRGIIGNQFNGTIQLNQVNQILAFDGQLYNNSGLAFQGYRSNTGNLLSTGLGFSYSKGYNVNDLKLKVGLNSGILIRNNILTTSVGQQTAPFLGAGFLAYYKGFFMGVSKPMIFASKRIFEQKPVYFQAGYIYDFEKFISFNANALFYNDFQSNKMNQDVNFKLWLNHRVGLGLSYRTNRIYNYLKNSTSFVPSLEYRLSKSTLLGMSYDSNVVNSISMPGSEIALNGVFQLTFKYTNDPEKGESTFYNKF